MESLVTDADAGERCLEAIDAALDGLTHTGVAPVDGDDARRWITELERVGRRVDALRGDLTVAIDTSGCHQADGFVSAKSMVSHVADLSPAEATARDRTRHALADLPHFAAAYATGEIATDKARLLGRIHANPRVKAAVADADEWFLEKARELCTRDFTQVVREWERLADFDGAADRNQHNHQRRDFRLDHHPHDLSSTISGAYGSFQGSSMAEIFDAYVAAEWEADWEKARAEHGDQACLAHLPRTAAQRRADAAWQIFHDAAGSSGSATGPEFTHNIVWSADSYQAMLDALDTDTTPDVDVETHRCSTLDGVPLDTTEALIDSLTSAFRRVVIDAAGTVIDLGRARLFTGSARHAALLQSPTCIWPGCHRPSSRCEVDHLVEHSRGGRTNPGNGAPLCGRHNRWKQKGFAARRGPTGTWHVQRPDGTDLN